MVCEKTGNSNHDFDKDPLKLIFDSKREYVFASNTTLGADDLHGVSFSLALTKVLKEHGPLQFLFTVEEEIGLVSALNLKEGNFVNGSVLLNLDVGKEGAITLGTIIL
jgi:dipeptidase D